MIPTGITDWISKTATFGSLGIYGLWATVALGIWKGLPNVLTAWELRASKQQERTDAEFARLRGQLDESDKRHEECQEGQRQLRLELNDTRRQHREEITSLYGQINQLRQLIASGGVAIGPVVDSTPPILVPLVQALDRIPGAN